MLGIYYSRGGVFACLSVCMWNSEIWFSGGLGSVKLMIDSMILEVFSYRKDFFVYLCCIPDFFLCCTSTSMAVMRKVALLVWEPEIFWYSVCTHFSASFH